MAPLTTTDLPCWNTGRAYSSLNTQTVTEKILLSWAWETQGCPDSCLEALSGYGAEEWKQTNLFPDARPMNAHMRTDTQEGWVTRNRGIHCALMCWTDRNKRNKRRVGRSAEKKTEKEGNEQTIIRSVRWLMIMEKYKKDILQLDCSINT